MPAVNTKSQGGLPVPGTGDAVGYDLLSLQPVRRFIVSPWYPGVLQAFSLLVFGLIIYFGLFGTIRPAYNFATVVTWTLWWPLLPLSLLLVGRLWCAMCPLVTAISLTQRLSKPSRMPGHLLRRYGVWLMAMTFIFITWANRLWSITSSPKATALLLLSLLGLAVVTALLYQRRAFCRYLCPIGAFSGLYAMTAGVELRSKGVSNCQGCEKDCFKGNNKAEGCPLYQYLRTMDTNRNCNLCGQCIKSCPLGVAELRLRLPGKDIWQLRDPLPGEALLALMLVAVVYIQTADMTTGWASYMRWLLGASTFISYNLGFTLTFLAALLVVVGIYTLVIRWSSIPGTWRKNFASFGYAYIPLALAVHLGHNWAHLMGEGPKALKTAFQTLANPLNTTALVSAQAGIPVLNQMIWMAPIVILGGLGSLYAAWRISKRMETQGRGERVLPHLLFLLILTGLFVHLFLLPMNLRHAH